jgi:hypothetical protein
MGCLEDMYSVTGQAAKAVDAYSAQFLEVPFGMAQATLTNLEPVKLSFGDSG